MTTGRLALPGGGGGSGWGSSSSRTASGSLMIGGNGTASNVLAYKSPEKTHGPSSPTKRDNGLPGLPASDDPSSPKSKHKSPYLVKPFLANQASSPKAHTPGSASSTRPPLAQSPQKSSVASSSMASLYASSSIAAAADRPASAAPSFAHGTSMGNALMPTTRTSASPVR